MSGYLNKTNPIIICLILHEIEVGLQERQLLLKKKSQYCFLGVQAPGRDKGSPSFSQGKPRSGGARGDLRSRSMSSGGSRPPRGAPWKRTGKRPGAFVPILNLWWQRLWATVSVSTPKPDERKVTFDLCPCSSSARDTPAWLDYWPSPLTSAPGACPLNLFRTALHNLVCAQLARINARFPESHPPALPPRA